MGQLFAFIIAFAESLPLIGTIIPGSVTMTAIGTLIGAAIIPGVSTLLWAAAGAFLGDSIGYSVGYKYTDRIRNMWPFKSRPHWLEMGESFFTKHGGKSIIIGRFVGPVRSTVPMIAGLMKLPLLRFVCAAAPSALMWAILYLVPGILLGAVAVELPPGKTTEVLIVGLIIIVALWLVFWLIQHFFRQLSRAIDTNVDALWNWASQKPGLQWCIRFITNQQRPSDHRQLLLSFVSMICLLLFFAVFAGVMLKTQLIAINLPVLHLLQSIRTPGLDRVFVFFTEIGEPILVALIGLWLAMLLALAKQRRASAHLILISATGFVCVGGIKTLFYNARPSIVAPFISSSSFPSGHSVLSLCIYGFIAFLIAEQSKRHWRWLPYTLFGLLIACVMFSRLYLGAHWLTDILGSILLGLSLLVAVVVLYRKMPHSRGKIQLSLAKWCMLLLVGVLLPWSANVYLHFKRDIVRFRPYQPTAEFRLSAWWNNPTAHLPIYRNNRFGHPYQPLNIQLAGNFNHLVQVLEKHGWRKLTHHHSLRSTLARLISKAPKYHQPLFSWQFKGQKSMIVLYHTIAHSNSILEIRIWHAFARFSDSALPLWVGALNIHLPLHRLINLKYHYPISFKTDQALTDVRQNMVGYKRKIVTIPLHQQPKNIRTLNWNGELLLLQQLPQT